MLKLSIFWLSYLVFPVIFAAAWTILRHRGALRLLGAVVLAGSCVAAYARFIEARILVVHEADIVLPGAAEISPSIRIALFSDTHVGMFGNAMPIRRIVRAINDEEVDAVMLAGDITYYPDPDDIPALLAPLAGLDAPLFAVLGNHDVGFPGPDLSNPVLAALDRVGAQIVQNRAQQVTLAGQDVYIAGASDLWQRRQDFGFSSGLTPGVPVLLLTHNPDTALNVPASFPYDLMLAGHTHGGQIRIPFLYQRFIPTRWTFDKELHAFPAPSGERLVYVTPGTGMVGLPMRFLMPPRVDILTIHLPETRDQTDSAP